MAKVTKPVQKVAVKPSKKDWKLKLVYEPIEKLTPWALNPRHNDEAAEKLCAVLDKHGFINPIIATPDGVIRAGHTRLKAAIKLGYKELPVIYVPFHSELEAEMYSIADNKASEWAQWNRDILSTLFKKTGNVNVAQVERLSGFSQVEIEGLKKRHSDLSAQTFSDAVEAFNRDNPGQVKKEYWAWMLLPDEGTLQALMQKFARKRGKEGRPSGRELHTEDFLKALQIANGGTCEACKGTGHLPEEGLRGRLRCPKCMGCGVKPLDLPAKKVVKKCSAVNLTAARNVVVKKIQG